MVPNSGNTTPMSSASMMDRLMGIITLKPATYKEVAEDRTATSTAAMIVIAVAIIVGIITGIEGAAGATSSTAGIVIGAIISSIILTPVGWLINGWLLAFVAKTFFQGDTDMGEMLRVTGFASVFKLASIIPIIGGLIALVLGIVANVIGIREAASLDTTKAVLTAIIAAVIAFIAVAILTLIILIPLVALGLAAGAVSTPTTP